MALLFIAIVIKLLYINIVQGEELTRKALNQLTRTEIVQADRGIIYDRNKRELAVNVTKGNAYYNMNFDKDDYKTTAEFNKYVEETVEEDSKKIAAVLEVEQSEVKDLLKGKKIVRIAANLSREKALELRDLKIPNLSVEDVTRRFYPYNNMASNLIGFVNDEGTGAYGIEAKYDEEMSGIAGKNISIKNNLMNQIPLTDEQNFAPKEGFNPVLTIDETIQHFAERAAEDARANHSAKRVSIIVQNTMTSEILAMAISQSYDLNNPKKPVSDEQEELWLNLDEKDVADEWFRNWNNSCVSSQYEPGSTFKLITAAAAIEENTTNPQREYVCPGVIDVGIKINCTSQNRGATSMEQAMAESCNITFVKIAQELGREKFLKYLRSFGFGSKTGIDLPAEAKGTIPEGIEAISGVRLATMSYGHGVAVTPIQLINAVSAIANGGNLNEPRVVDRFEDRNGNIIQKFKTMTLRKVVSESTSEVVKKLMRKVVEEGTGKRAQIPGYQVGGKTGTANVVSKDGIGYEEDAYISSFVGVAPLNDPKITVLVIVEEPKGDFFASTVAVPAAKTVIEDTLKYMEIPKTEEINEEESAGQVTVPNVRNLLLSDAGKALVDLGLTFNTNSDNITDVSTVMRQNPSAGVVVKAGSIIDLYINENDGDEKVMPNLVGKKIKDLEGILKDLNIKYNILGSGEVISQSIKPGSKFDETSVLEL
ncbi:MAG: penicillin-binding transpeptidase domain-containing protein, partial [Peptoniphilus sp.]|nr:penicillin-binding transpeptidase domain-containing protein [Peptoniphilus sp.]